MGLVQAAKEGQLDSLRLFISGAEKASAEVFKKVKLRTKAQLFEGYGLTECSPAVTSNRFGLPPKGVGYPLDRVELCFIHPESLELLAPGVDGEICVHGPNVFNGYLPPSRSPFIEIQGKRWFRTGDIGHQEPGGALILSGRLKRFAKIGGEMISLGAIEETLDSKLRLQGKISSELPSFALLVDESDVEKSRLVLFVAMDIAIEQVNDILHNAGFSRLIKISTVQKIDEIPLSSNGKIDYRALKSKI
jgi:long-chain-fatty-acid--[acyl-carrier-protein] ligase